MSDVRTCSECGTPLNNDAAEGFCPACMLAGALALGGRVGAPSPIASKPLFGEYELLEEIACGGMGVVYRARQVSLDRIVALKLILAGRLANIAAIRRFRAEAAIAARLRHPNIVAIHEVGEEAGQHFFSMDYVDGPNLADFARQQPISIRQAALFLKTIAEAIHYAHCEGIVHRDLKPSNILIDGAFEPRVTDFGLARNLKADLNLTLTGQVLGSPNYISPEQASGKETVGVASDIYSLGAILYHLLSGRPPFAAETLTDTLQQVTTKEAVSPRLLNPSVPKDLETICLKCLEKEPGKRYASAAALGEELSRFLRDEPIRARAVSRVEKVWRWSRRRPTAAAALGLLLIVAIGSPIAALRINHERQQAEEARKQAEANEKKAKTEATKSRHVADFVKQMLNAVGPSVALGRDTTILREILDETAERLGEGLKHEPAVEAELRHAIGQVYGAIGEYHKAGQMLRQSAEIRQTVHGPDSLQVLESLETLAWVLRHQGEHVQAATLLRQTLPVRTKLLGEAHPTVAYSLYHLAMASWNSSELVQLEALHRDALAMRRKLFGEEHPDIALLFHGLGIVMERQSKLNEAELLYRQALAMRRKLLGEDHPDVPYSFASVCGVVAAQNAFAEAEKLYRELVAMLRDFMEVTIRTWQILSNTWAMC